ncbi:patatin-like phospholipase domain-containing protein 4 [Lethenteron reissneri]|uniref:patatin-like phospholipase domain-containing protein 4 n=1 Tax=Lethenteron reissneri TaxID=7753 RepID=UPI002AB6BBE7|nr:patatin-like phospholipase domain-containing protein 4 [Lethenteron reissneri]XP_061432874.1 patatin-like phospholipase domain-containing protein 4 [Lethenteron reissneri]
MEAIIVLCKALMYAACFLVIITRAFVNAALFTIRDSFELNDDAEPGDERVCRKRENIESWSVSMPGAGFLLPYQLGICMALHAHGVPIAHAAGSSSGSLAAALLTLAPHRSKEMSSMVSSYAAQGHGATLSFRLIPKLREILEQILPLDSHTLATGRLFVSVTRLPDGQNRIISDFDTREELIQVLLASCLFPFYSGISGICYRGEMYCDGGFTDNQPFPKLAQPCGVSASQGLISVSPFEGTQAICPRGICPTDGRILRYAGLDFKMGMANLQRLWHALFPPSREKLELYFEDGYRDAMDFLEQIKAH